MTTETTEDAIASEETVNDLPNQMDGESHGDYYRRLREENRKHREKWEQWKNRAQDAEGKLRAAEQAKVDAETAVENHKVAAKTQIALTKIEAIAAKKGAIDTDVLEKLIDPATFVYDDAGKISNADELVNQLMADKPYLFGSQSTASTAKAPAPAVDTGPKKVSAMTPEEKKAHFARLGLR